MSAILSDLKSSSPANSPMTWPNRQLDIGVALLLVASFASVPAWADRGLVFLASVVLLNIVFAQAFNIVFGLSGMVSFGHAAFFAAGAYVTGSLLKRVPELHVGLAWLASGVAGALVAAAIAGLLLRRSSGIYFAILTLAFAELLHVVISKTTFFGREDGLTGIGRPVLNLGFATIDLASGNHLYYVTLVIVVVLVALIYALSHNRLGRQLAALRQDAERLRFLGVRVAQLRFTAFVLSGLFAGLAGGLYAPAAQLLTPDIAHWHYSALPLLYCLVGGAGYFWGPALGAIVFMGLEHSTRNITGLSEIVIGGALLLVVLAFPGGLIGGLQRLHDMLTRTKRSPGQGAGRQP